MQNGTLSTLMNANLIYKNFSGKTNEYNTAGLRSFSILITDPEMAAAMAEDGWNIKELRKRDENDPQHWHLPVAIGYKAYPPEIIMIKGHGATTKKVHLSEDMLDQLDYATIENVDLTIRARVWESRGKGGVKAYLKKMYVTIEEDPLDAKYAELV